MMSGSDRDAGFCSGGDEDDMSGLHSPSASENSVEVQISPISLRNKRKLAEPRKIQEQSTAPLKKRRFDRMIIQDNSSDLTFEDTKTTITRAPSPSPFRPWSSPSKSDELNNEKTSENSLNENYQRQEKIWQQEEECRRQEAEERKHEKIIQQEVLARLQEFEMRRPTSPDYSQTSRSSDSQKSQRKSRSYNQPSHVPSVEPTLTNQDEPLALVLRGETPRVPEHPDVSGNFNQTDFNSEQNSTSFEHQRHQNGQRNYKNMTRERRIEANARERTRVHTISAAFDTLRRSIPAYSHNQKLSKLSVLRIACSYIMTLSKIATTPEGEDTNGDELGACVDLVSRTIQTEGKLRKKKDE